MMSYKTVVGQYYIFSKSGMKRLQVYHTPKPLKVSQMNSGRCFLVSCGSHLLGHRWQTHGQWAESGPPPCFIRPGNLFLPGSAKLLALS